MEYLEEYVYSIKKYQYNIVTQAEESLFMTTRDINFKLTNGNQVFIKAGYKTDLASVPRFLWSIVPPFGEYTFAAIIHDYLYENGLYSKRFADREFKHIMRNSDVILSKRFVMYISVKFFGKGNF